MIRYHKEEGWGRPIEIFFQRGVEAAKGLNVVAFLTLESIKHVYGNSHVMLRCIEIGVFY